MADEVRNLAQRAGQAAKETTALIEDAVENARQGTSVAESVGKTLSSIVGHATKVGDLVAGIAKASDEQAQGITQINQAISQMDRTVQQNSGSAEESAQAAEHLRTQATGMLAVVDSLAALVGAATAQVNEIAKPTKTVRTTQATTAKAKQATRQPAKAPGPPSAKAVARPASKLARRIHKKPAAPPAEDPNEIMPPLDQCDDGDLSQF